MRRRFGAGQWNWRWFLGRDDRWAGVRQGGEDPEPAAVVEGGWADQGGCARWRRRPRDPRSSFRLSAWSCLGDAGSALGRYEDADRGDLAQCGFADAAAR